MCIEQLENTSFDIKSDIAFIGLGKDVLEKRFVFRFPNMYELKKILQVLHSMHKFKGVIFFSHHTDFLNGVDVNLIYELKDKEQAEKAAMLGQEVFNLIEDLPCITIACVEGVCVGAGLELALSCDRILSIEKKKILFGLPEIKLGVMPGFGGTFRLARKVNQCIYKKMVYSGKYISVKQASEYGLIDQLCMDSLIDCAIQNIQQTASCYHKKELDIDKRTLFLRKEALNFAELCVSEASKALQATYLKKLQNHPGLL